MLQAVWVVNGLVTTAGVVEGVLELVEAGHHCWNASMMEDDNWQLIERPCEGEAVCFDLQAEMKLTDGAVVSVLEQGFMVCFQGELRAWRNHCPHAGSPLDWIPGQFFDAGKRRLICHTHHAEFEPLSGECIAGPCPRGLYALPIKEINKTVSVPLRIVL